MSNFPKRNALLGGVALLSLLSALYVPAAMAANDNAKHNQHAAEAAAASDNPAPAMQGKATQMPQMDHGAMSHGAMDHSAMNHAWMNHSGMMGGQDGAAEAGANHDR